MSMKSMFCVAVLAALGSAQLAPIMRFSHVQVRGLVVADEHETNRLEGRSGFVEGATSEGWLVVKLEQVHPDFLPEKYHIHPSYLVLAAHPDRPRFGALRREPLRSELTVDISTLSGLAAKTYSRIWSGDRVHFSITPRVPDNLALAYGSSRGGVLKATAYADAELPGTEIQLTLSVLLMDRGTTIFGKQVLFTPTPQA